VRAHLPWGVSTKGFVRGGSSEAQTDRITDGQHRPQYTMPPTPVYRRGDIKQYLVVSVTPTKLVLIRSLVAKMIQKRNSYS